jgi:hypothetical protein
MTVSPSDRLRPEAVAGNRNSPQGHIWCCRTISLTEEGPGTMAIMRAASTAGGDATPG